MKTYTHIRHSLRLLIAVACLVTAASIVAQPAGAPGGGRRGGPPNLSPEEVTALNSFNTKLAAEAQAVTLASSNLIAVTYSTPKDEAKIVAANTALAKAREAWAKKASEEFAKVQASPNKLSEAAIAQLIASAPGGRGGRGGPGGFGGGGRGPGGPGAGGPPRQQ